MWWLIVFLLIDGKWVHGAETDRWHPRAYQTETICRERKAFAETALIKLEKGHKAQWFCSKERNATLEELKRAGQE